jgi:hypothetical protein
MTLALAPSGFMEAISGWVCCHSVEYFITRKRTENMQKEKNISNIHFRFN